MMRWLETETSKIYQKLVPIYKCKRFQDWRPPQLRPSTLLLLQRVLATLALQTSHEKNVQPGAKKGIP